MPHYCHACRRPTHGVQSGQELACVRCGVVGFVEELPATDEPRGVSRRPERSTSINDPFQLMHLFFREMNRPVQVTRSPDRQVTVIAGGGPDQGGIAFLGAENPFAFLPDALDAILTAENIDNLLTHILAQRSGNTGPPPAAEQVRKNLWKETLTAQKAADGGECAVCQESFKEGEEITHITRDVKKCPHFFHTQCIMPWLERHNTCCVCRYQLPTDDAQYERQREVIHENLNRSLSSRPGSTTSHRSQLHPSPNRPTREQHNGYSVRFNNNGRAQVAPAAAARRTPASTATGQQPARPTTRPTQGLQLVGSRDEPSYAHLAHYNEAPRPLVASPLAAARARQDSRQNTLQDMPQNTRQPTEGLARTGPSVDMTGLMQQRIRQESAGSLAEAPPSKERPVGRGMHPLAQRYAQDSTPMPAPMAPAQTAPLIGSRQPQPYTMRPTATSPYTLRPRTASPTGSPPSHGSPPPTRTSTSGPPLLQDLRRRFNRLFSHGN